MNRNSTKARRICVDTHAWFNPLGRKCLTCHVCKGVIGEIKTAGDQAYEEGDAVAVEIGEIRLFERIVQSVSRGVSGDVCQTSDFDDARVALAKARGEA